MREDALTGALRYGQVAVAHADTATTQDSAQTSQDPTLAEESAGLAQLALRARLNAFVLDALVVGVVTVPLLGLPGKSSNALEELLLDFGLLFAYFFLCESHGGRTLGKRICHVHVATLTGAQPSAGQVAIRNAARLLDALPLMYASGLISMMRTGPDRRQRIGDVLAGTTVVLDAGRSPGATPRWLLPTITFLAILLSLAVILPLLGV